MDDLGNAVNDVTNGAGKAIDDIGNGVDDAMTVQIIIDINTIAEQHCVPRYNIYAIILIHKRVIYYYIIFWKAFAFFFL